MTFLRIKQIYDTEIKVEPKEKFTNLNHIDLNPLRDVKSLAELEDMRSISNIDFLAEQNRVI